MKVKHGHPTLDMKQNWIHSICVASDEICVTLGRTEFQTPLCWRRPNAQAYKLYSAKDALDGCDTYARWEKEGFQRTFSTVSLKRVHVKLAVHSFASKMFARGIWSLQPLTEKVGSLWLKMAASRKRGNRACRAYTKHANKWRREISEKPWAQ